MQSLCLVRKKGVFLVVFGGREGSLSIASLLALSFVYHLLFPITLLYLSNQRQQVMR